MVCIAAITTGPNTGGTNVINSTTVTGGNFSTNASGNAVITGQLTVTNINGVKVYRALLTQVGENDPSATVLENTLGGTPLWSYSAEGTYSATLAGAFPVNKVFCRAGGSAFHVDVLFSLYRSDNDSLTLGDRYLGEPTDGMLLNTPVEILVYP